MKPVPVLRLLLAHLRNRLSAQTLHALMCLSSWSHNELIDRCDICAITQMELVSEIEGDEDGDVLLSEDFADIVDINLE